MELKTIKEKNGIGKTKSICVLLVVIACFLVLWPKIFYPMLKVGIKKYTYNNRHDDLMLPPKVRHAMNTQTSIQKNPKRKVLPGEPRLHAQRRFTAGGGDNVSTNSRTGNIFNMLIPSYVILMGSFLLYKLLTIAWKDNESLNNNKKCDQCYYYEDICKTTKKKNKTKSNDPFESLPTYKAFDYYGPDKVRQSLESLIRDMEVFRSHMIKAEICRCKLNKVHMAKAAVTKHLEDINKYLNDKDQTIENNDKDDDDQSKVKKVEDIINKDNININEKVKFNEMKKIEKEKEEEEEEEEEEKAEENKETFIKINKQNINKTKEMKCDRNEEIKENVLSTKMINKKNKLSKIKKHLKWVDIGEILDNISNHKLKKRIANRKNDKKNC